MFPAGGYNGCDADLLDTNCKEDNPRTTVTKFGSNWSGGFRGEGL